MQPVTDLQRVSTAFETCPSFVSLRNHVETAGAKIGLMVRDKPFCGETPRTWEKDGMVHFDMTTPPFSPIREGEFEVSLFVSHSPQAFKYKRIAFTRIGNVRDVVDFNALAETIMKSIADTLSIQGA